MSDEREDLASVTASSESGSELVPAADSNLSVSKNGDSGSENGVEGDRGSTNGHRSGGSENEREFDQANLVRTISRFFLLVYFFFH